MEDKFVGRMTAVCGMDALPMILLRVIEATMLKDKNASVRANEYLEVEVVKNPCALVTKTRSPAKLRSGSWECGCRIGDSRLDRRNESRAISSRFRKHERGRRAIKEGFNP